MACIERSVGGDAFAPIHANDNFDGLDRADMLSGCEETDLILSSSDSFDFANLAGNAVASFGVARNRLDPRDLFVDFDVTITDQFSGGSFAIATLSGDAREKSGRNGENHLATLTGATNVTADDLLIPPHLPVLVNGTGGMPPKLPLAPRHVLPESKSLPRRRSWIVEPSRP